MCCNYFPEKKLTKWCNGVFSNFDPVCCFVRIDMMVFWYAPSCECCVCVLLLPQCWSLLLVEGELPEPRDRHAACCLNYNGSHPQLLISGGLDRRDQVLGDCWLLCVVMRRWRKVTC